MGLLDRAGKAQAAQAAPAVEFFADPLTLSEIATQQAKQDGKPDQWRDYIDTLNHATDSAALPFQTRPVFRQEAFRALRQKWIRRADYVAWLQSIGEPPPAWWICEGETVQQPVEEEQKRGRGRPNDPSALKHRMKELQADAIEAARTMSEPDRAKVAAALSRSENWCTYTAGTIEPHLRARWWKT